MYRLSAVVAFMVAPSVALAQEAPVPISDVSVTVEIEAVDSNALDRWPEIGPDLTAAILAASAPYIAEDGLSVAVVLNEVSLGGTTVLGEGGEFNRLGGWVYIRDDPAQPPIFSEEIEFEAETFALGGTSQFYIVPGRPDFYNALVNVFAARVVEEVAAAD
ncbi:MAG: hypothetical protein MUF63_12670 [Rhodobacteraceae bacterium]|jgi:hypothetical protein|nr:hypothetical protein [Paracoccaceae bacterium]